MKSLKINPETSTIMTEQDKLLFNCFCPHFKSWKVGMFRKRMCDFLSSKINRVSLGVNVLSIQARGEEPRKCISNQSLRDVDVRC